MRKRNAWAGIALLTGAGAIVFGCSTNSGSGPGLGTTSCSYGAVQQCLCPDNTVSSQSCNAMSAWDACACTQQQPGICVAGQVQACACLDGTASSQTCNMAGVWDVCVCGTTPPVGCAAGQVQACTCLDGTPSSQSCNALGAWDACVCGGVQPACVAGQVQACSCLDGTPSQQSCNALGAWDACICGGVGGAGGTGGVVTGGGTGGVVTGGGTGGVVTGGGTGGVVTGGGTGGVMTGGGTGGVVTGGGTGGGPTGNAPTLDGGYVSSGAWQGYAWTAVDAEGSTTVSPATFATVMAGDSLCATGTVATSPTYESFAMVGINLNQDSAPDSPVLTYTPTGSSICISLSGTAPSGRLQIQTAAGQRWCEDITIGTNCYALSGFNTACWDDTGTAYAGAALEAAMVLIPGDMTVTRPFNFCVDNIYEQ